MKMSVLLHYHKVSLLELLKMKVEKNRRQPFLLSIPLSSGQKIERRTSSSNSIALISNKKDTMLSKRKDKIPLKMVDSS